MLDAMDGLAVAMERGFRSLSSELRRESGSVRSELRSELRSEIGKLRHDMNLRFDRVDDRFDAFERRVSIVEVASHTHPTA
ncbi:MAG: hypothetical protein NVS2B3_00570 [Vulcanimicrobiaceae bacterium]